MTTIRQLEYIAAIEKFGTFQAAADACHVTQPGLSAQVRQLEESLCVEIFERGRKPVLVTAAGREILRHAHRVLSAKNELHHAALGLNQTLTGRLRLGVIPTVAPFLIPRILPTVRRRYPKLRLELREEQTHQLVEALEKGELDVLLVALEAPLGNVTKVSILDDRFLLAVPRGHRLAKRKRVRDSDLTEESVLLLEDGHCLRNQALSICSRAGVTEFGDFRATSLTTLISMVASGVGVTLLPSLAMQDNVLVDEDLVLVPFGRPFPKRTIGLVWRKTSSRKGDYAELASIFRESAIASAGRRG